MCISVCVVYVTHQRVYNICTTFLHELFFAKKMNFSAAFFIGLVIGIVITIVTFYVVYYVEVIAP